MAVYPKHGTYGIDYDYHDRRYRQKIGHPAHAGIPQQQPPFRLHNTQAPDLPFGLIGWPLIYPPGEPQRDRPALPGRAVLAWFKRAKR